MPKFVIIKEAGDGWEAFEGSRVFYNTLEAAVGAASWGAVELGRGVVAVAKVVRRVKGETRLVDLGVEE
jgi:hypothetical protein